MQLMCDLGFGILLGLEAGAIVHTLTIPFKGKPQKRKPHEDIVRWRKHHPILSVIGALLGWS